MKAEEFRKMWLQQNPDVVHIPSQHELGLMQAYAEYYAQSQLPKETKPSILGQEHIDPNEVHSSGIQTSETDIPKEEDLLDDVTNILHHNHNEGWVEDRETARKILKRIFISPKEREEVCSLCAMEIQDKESSLPTEEEIYKIVSSEIIVQDDIFGVSMESAKAILTLLKEKR